MKYPNYLKPGYYVNQYRLNTEKFRLRHFKDKHRLQKRCFLVGNGPSIKGQDLTHLRDEVVFVTNHFILHEQYDGISPDYYCVCDDRMFQPGHNEDWLNQMHKKASRTVKFFPYRSRGLVSSDARFDSSSTFYIRHLPGKIWDLGTMALDPSRGVYSGDTIMIDYCIPLAFYMGFTEIYLVGCDCDYGLDQAKDFSKGYFFDSKLATTERQSVQYLQQHWTHHVFQSYQVAKNVLNAHGCQIFNATEGGKLEVFERKNLNEVLGISSLAGVES